jgi:integrase
MGRSNPGERARTRVLTDDEIRAVWRTAEKIFSGEVAGTPGLQMFAKLLQFVLLTGVRRNEAARMDRRERSGADWLIPAARVKAKRDFLVPLSGAAGRLLDSIPIVGSKDSGPIFTTDGERPLACYTQFKDAFDEKCGVSGWTVHDLRRTARSLMSRAGVPSDHAERAIGHVIGGIRGIYDRYAYRTEKLQAFEALAALIERILNPPEDNVIPLRKLEVPA